MIVAAIVAATIVASGHAFAVTTLDYDPTETINPVADNITRLNVNKLEKGARDYVEGAHMAIYEKDTGRLVTEWVTDGKVHEVARNAEGNTADGALNVDTVYILRELEAPEGYAKAEDVEFVIHSDNFNTTGELLSGTDDGNADSEEIRGSGPEQAFVINLYDEATLNVEDVEQRRRERQQEREEQQERERENSNSDSSSSTTTTTTTRTTRTTTGNDQPAGSTRSGNGDGLTKTGDDTSYVPAIVIGVIGAGAITAAIFLRKRR